MEPKLLLRKSELNPAIERARIFCLFHKKGRNHVSSENPTEEEMKGEVMKPGSESDEISDPDLGFTSSRGYTSLT